MSKEGLQWLSPKPRILVQPEKTLAATVSSISYDLCLSERRGDHILVVAAAAKLPFLALTGLQEGEMVACDPNVRLQRQGNQVEILLKGKRWAKVPWQVLIDHLQQADPRFEARTAKKAP